MAVTRSRSAERPAVRRGGGGPRAPWRWAELGWLAAASVVVLTGLVLVYGANNAALAEVDAGLASKRLLNLNGLGAREELLPALSIIPNQRERETTAQKIYYLSGTLSNVGRIRSALTADQ